MLEILGYLGALLIGVTLGIIGGGGSILTVPVLAYLFLIDPVLATAYSLFVVGLTATIGAYQYFRRELVDLKTAVVFSVPSFTTVFLTRLYLVPAIPDSILTIGSFTITKSIGIMTFFAVIMFFSALSMIYNKKPTNDTPGKQRFNYPLILIEGAVVGVITGIVGAGGGFLIVPALVLFARLPIKLAVGTSLVVISIKSLIGFLGDVGAGQSIEWGFLFVFSALAVVGVLLGSQFSKKIEGDKIKKVFGWSVLIMAIIIVYKELT